MTSQINVIDTGSNANDGTGDPIRTAFGTVNDNFDYINSAIFVGASQTIISATSVTAGYVHSNTYVNADSVVANTVTSNGNLFVSQGGSYIVGNVTIIGSMSITGTQTASQSQSSTGSILNLHYSATPLTLDDGRDIGLEWQYYKGAEKKAFFGWQNSTRSLVYLDDITESVGNVITAGTPGNVKIGSLTIANTTAATSNTTGALQIIGGISSQGNLYVQGNVVSNRVTAGNVSFAWHEGILRFSGSDTIYINGSPVQTAAQAFQGGGVNLDTTFLSLTNSTSTGTGAVTVFGGLGVAGNAYFGNIFLPLPGLYYGNIGTNAQPFITSLGALTSLSVAGQITSQNIIPIDASRAIGSLTNRYQNIYGFNLDLSGTLTGATVNSTGGTHSGVLNFTNNTQATSSSTGAVRTTGGMSIATGNLYIGGSRGNAIIATGNTYSLGTTFANGNGGNAIVATGNTYSLGTTFANGNGGNAIVATGNIWVSGNVLPFGANLTHNLGSPTQWWNTFYGISTQAQYADLAENYVADSNYDVGTVVVFGGVAEITVTSSHADHRVAGVVSEKPAYLMNASTPGTAIALRGRVPVKVTGPVVKGDLLVTSTVSGYATSVGSDSSYGIKVFAKSLETNNDDGSKLVEAVIL
jgi:hypothetical protein